MAITVLIEPWRADPLAWIHRAEARAVARELRDSGAAAPLRLFRGAGRLDGLRQGPLLLRLSDPVMLAAVRALAHAAIPYVGPGAPALERCYDKYSASRLAAAGGVDIPATELANGADGLPFPLLVKPRRGSDSIGLRLIRAGPLPARLRADGFIAQEFVRGSELTVATLHGEAGVPLEILLPEGVPYSFWRKYLLRPRRRPVQDPALRERVRETARRIVGVLGVDWAARVDFIHEAATGRLRFLECDAAPLVGPASAFAASLAAAGMDRREQLRQLLARTN